MKICSIGFRLLTFLIIVASLSSVFWSKKKKQFAKDCDEDSQYCDSISISVFNNGDWSNGVSLILTKEDCSSKQVLGDIVCPKLGFNANCSLYSAWGTRATSCVDLRTDENVFIVTSGRLFMLPTAGIGSRMEIQHIGMPAGKPIILETLSIQPRIFKLYNFFTGEEADELINYILQSGDSLKRSSTVSSKYQSHDRRTSSTAFDTRSETAVQIKKRSFDLLGIFPFEESLADGLQIVRYEPSHAYHYHLDWINSNDSNTKAASNNNNLEHNYDSANDGTNRYASLIMYLSDVEEGGETAFPEVDSDTIKYFTDECMESEFQQSSCLQITASNHTNRNLTALFPKHSWQQEMHLQCRNSFSVKPKKGEAILFYSQLPNGNVDSRSIHGGCPVIQGEKWIANLWIWNGPRHGYWKRNSVTGKNEKPIAQSVSASFESKDINGAMLYWEDQYWEELSPGRPIKVNTFSGHKWHVKMDGSGSSGGMAGSNLDELLITWVIQPNKPSQRFILTADDLPVFTN